MNTEKSERRCPRCNGLVLRRGLDDFDSCFVCGYIDASTLCQGRRYPEIPRQTFTSPPDKPGRTPPNGLTVNTGDNQLQRLCVIPWARAEACSCHHFIVPDAGRYPRRVTMQVCKLCGLVEKVSNIMPSTAQLYGAKLYGGREGKARHDDDARVTAIVTNRDNHKDFKRPKAPKVDKWVWRTMDGLRIDPHEAESLELAGAR